MRPSSESPCAFELRLGCAGLAFAGLQLTLDEELPGQNPYGLELWLLLLALGIGLVIMTSRHLRERRFRNAAEERASAAERARLLLVDQLEAWFDPMAELDQDFRFKEVNAELISLLGRSDESELLGVLFSDLVLPQDWPEFRDAVHELQRGEVELGRCRIRLRAVDESILFISLRVAVRDAREDCDPCYALKFVDETESWRTTTHLRVTERALQAAACGIAICETNEPDMPIVYVNAAFERITGFSASDVLGRNCRFLNEGDRGQPALDEVRDALQQGRGTTVILRNHRSDGTPFWNELTLSPITDADGDVTHYVGFIDDVSAHMEFAAEKERLLAASITAKRRADEAARARDRLLAIVSHELRSPLNSIRLWTSILRSEESPSRDLLTKALAHIETGIRVQSRLIEDLLDASRFESGRFELERRRVDLHEVLTSVCESLAPEFEAKSITLERQLAPGHVHVLGDPARLEQIVQNLLENALKFTPEGKSVQIASRLRHGRVHVEVRDQGEGIPAELLPRIFDQFVQGEAHEVRRHGGLGLGLNIVRHLVEHHGGTIRASSDGPGRGACFIVELPLERQRLQYATATSETGESARSVDEILIVDDDNATVEALALGLHLQGYAVRTARNGESAWKELQASRPTLILSDLMMPELSGSELMRRVRVDEFERGLPRVPAIAMSGRGSPSDEHSVRRAGFERFLRKPIQLDELLKALREVLSQSAKTPARQALIAVPDREMAEELRERFVGLGYETLVVSTSADALILVIERTPDILVLSEQLPDGPGAALLEHAATGDTRVFTVLLRESDSKLDLRTPPDLELTPPADAELLARELAIWGGRN